MAHTESNIILSCTESAGCLYKPLNDFWAFMVLHPQPPNLASNKQRNNASAQMQFPFSFKRDNCMCTRFIESNSYSQINVTVSYTLDLLITIPIVI